MTIKKILKYSAVIALPVIVTAVLTAGNIIAGFTAESQNEVIDIEWKTTNESNVESFEIERSLKAHDNFRRIHTENAKGSPSDYKYIDRDAFKPSEKGPELQSTNTYYYRLKIVKENGSYEYSDAINVIHKTSSVRKTWGMIKEMMR